MGRIRIGLSGWNYRAWRGDFYPDSLRRRDELSFVADHFPTVEVNGTFYGLTSPETVRRWGTAVPPGFTFAIKGSRFITHNKKLAGVDTALANFLASGLLELEDKLGPMLWQVSPHLHFDADRIDAFLRLLPRDAGSAAALARKHDERVREAALGPGGTRRLRHVIEVRHPSWMCAEMVSIARRHGVALAFSHAAAWPYFEEVTAGFVYLRLHGPGRLYASPYGPAQLAQWARRIQCWHQGGEPDDAVRITRRSPPRRRQRDVYVYFDNDENGYAPRDAMLLQELVRRRS